MRRDEARADQAHPDRLVRGRFPGCGHETAILMQNAAPALAGRSPVSATRVEGEQCATSAAADRVSVRRFSRRICPEETQRITVAHSGRETAMQSTSFDAIVVGSGISGGWAAKELTEKGLRVLLLERGRNVEHIKDYVDATKAP
ncbi:MAG TPA: NAD(P)-binding protein, partial [Ramlibacter sp.]|nr:NAD(P)-binding protein [Ramlibacter sp.]